MKLIRTKILLGLFIIATFADFFMSLAVKLKQPHFNETNPIYMFTGQYWLLFFWKLLAGIYFYFYLIRWYNKRKIMWERYFLISLIVVSIITQITSTYTAKDFYVQPAEKIVEVPHEQRVEQYKSQMLFPTLNLYAWLIIIYVVWRLVEVEQNGYSRK